MGNELLQVNFRAPRELIDEVRHVAIAQHEKMGDFWIEAAKQRLGKSPNELPAALNARNQQARIERWFAGLVNDVAAVAESGAYIRVWTKASRIEKLGVHLWDAQVVEPREPRPVRLPLEGPIEVLPTRLMPWEAFGPVYVAKSVLEAVRPDAFVAVMLLAGRQLLTVASPDYVLTGDYLDPSDAAFPPVEHVSREFVEQQSMPESA